jgi:hypothetical protein
MMHGTLRFELRGALDHSRRDPRSSPIVYRRHDGSYRWTLSTRQWTDASRICQCWQGRIVHKGEIVYRENA